LLFAIDASQNTSLAAINTYAYSAYAAANLAGSSANTLLLQAAMASANANISLLFAIDNAQNTSLAAVNTYAYSAYAAANLAGSSANTLLLQGAMASANANISYLFAIDAAQNTSLAAINTYAYSAYAAANLAGSSANTLLLQSAMASANANIALLQGAMTSANANISYLLSIDNAQNTNISSINTYAYSAYTQANSASSNTIYLQGGLNTANANSSLLFGYVNAANANIALLQGAMASANANISYLLSIDNAQNTNISGVNTYSYSAYAQANSASSNTIYLQGGLNSVNANTVAINTYAYSAYTQANSASSNTVYLQGGLNTANANIAFILPRANTGYNFVTSGGTISGSTTIQGNLNVTGNITFTGNTTTQVITGNTGQFFGYTANGFNALYTGIPTGYLLEPQIINQFTANYNGYAGGVNIQNINSGANASGDIFISADNGTINDGFLDLGLGSSNYNYPGYNLIGKNDGYWLVTGNTITGGGNMIMSTGYNNDIIFALGGTNTNNEVARFKYGTGLVLNGIPVKFADGTIQNTAGSSVANTVYLQGALNTANANSSLLFGYVNSANANISYLFAIDAAQNTSLNAINTYSYSAYTQANSASSNTVYLQGALNTANANTIYLQGGLNTVNANTVAINTYAFAAYTQANSASSNTVYLQGALNTANANTIYLQGALNSVNANTVAINTYAFAAYTQANSASANTIYLQGALASENANSTLLFSYVNAANNNLSANVSYLQGVDNQANANIALLQGAMTSANANIAGLWVTSNNALPNTGSLITVNGASQVVIANTTPTVSTTTGALVVKGGVGIGGSLQVGTVTTSNYFQSYATNQPIYSMNGPGTLWGSIGNINTPSAQTWALGYSTSSSSWVTNNSGQALTWANTGVVTATGNVASTSNTTGSLVVQGGLGVSGNTYVSQIYTTGGPGSSATYNDVNAAGSIGGNLYFQNMAAFQKTGTVQIELNHAGGGWGAIGNPYPNTWYLGWTPGINNQSLLWGSANNASNGFVTIPSWSNLYVANTSTSAVNVAGGIVANTITTANAVLTGGTIDNMVIGGTTQAAGSFTSTNIVGSTQNLLLYSNSFGTAPWSLGFVTVSTTSATTDPFGGTNAYKLVSTNSTGNHILSQIIPYNLNVQYTLSFYAKAAEYNYVQIDMSDKTSGDVSSVINLSTGSTGTVTNGGTWTGGTATAIPVSNGWYRIVLTSLKGSNSGTGMIPSIYAANNTGAISFTGDGTSGIYIYGAQIEQSSTIHPYLATTIAAISGSPTLSLASNPAITQASNGNLYITPSSGGTTNVSSNLTVMGGQATTSNTTGALVVQGGIGATGNVYVTGGSITINNGLPTTGNSGTIFLGDGVFTKTYGSAWTFIGGVQTDNGFKVTGAGNIQASAGSNTSPSILQYGGGTGGIYFPPGNIVGLVSNNANGLFVTAPTGGVNYLQTSGAVTGNSVVLSSQGTDANVSMLMAPKGTGAFDISTANGVNLSSNTSVTALTRTTIGSGYTSFPTVTISAPTTAGGVQAIASVGSMVNVGATVQSGGTGYSVNDVLTVVGGTPTGIAATLTVTSVSSGVITSVSATNFGQYTVLPTNPVSVTGGTGSSATLNLTWTIGTNPSFTITNAGSGYVEQPTVTISGGGGSGAAAYATVGSIPTVKSIGGGISFTTPSGEQFRVLDNTTTAVNYVTAKGSGTGSAANIGVAGTDGSISLGFFSKSVGQLTFYTNGGNQTQMAVSHTASAVNYVQVTGGTTGTTGGNGPTFSAQGSDSSINLNYVTKQYGYHNFSAAGYRNFSVSYGFGVITNFGNVYGGAAGNGPVYGVGGSDANIALNLVTTGNAAVQITGNTTGYIPSANSIYVGNRVGYANANNVSQMYQYYNGATNSYDLVFG
jgi:hypothetical protein